MLGDLEAALERNARYFRQQEEAESLSVDEEAIVNRLGVDDE
jgi:hypothetical protein